MPIFNPYLNFKGNAEEAFNFYKSVFGGEFASVMRFGDMPDVPAPEEAKDKIMHIALPVNVKGFVLMGSDAFGPMSDNFIAGNNFYISVSTASEEEARHLFSGLSEGGSNIMPLEKMFWGALFSHFTDKFGTNWMISYDENYPQ